MPSAGLMWMERYADGTLSATRATPRPSRGEHTTALRAYTQSRVRKAPDDQMYPNVLVGRQEVALTMLQAKAQTRLQAATSERSSFNRRPAQVEGAHAGVVVPTD